MYGPDDHLNYVVKYPDGTWKTVSHDKLLLAPTSRIHAWFNRGSFVIRETQRDGTAVSVSIPVELQQAIADQILAGPTTAENNGAQVMPAPAEDSTTAHNRRHNRRNAGVAETVAAVEAGNLADGVTIPAPVVQGRFRGNRALRRAQPAS